MPPASNGKRLRSLAFQLLRFAFRAVPMSTARRDSLREWFLNRFPRIRPTLPQGQPSTSVERRPRVHSGGRAIGYVERRDEPLPDPLPATLVAFYLPQFHTIPENDEWWGKGFTEWRNVARALPQFEGHQQPRLPGDLGFYDLRNPQVLRNQAELAQAYGIGAFCMYFYWFGGKTLLELPHQQWLDDPSISLPICLCWANEDWTRTWDGRPGEVLIAQEHSPPDDLAFIAHIARYLRDPRYFRIDGKPVLVVYRPGTLPDPIATTGRWRAWCRHNKIGEIFLAYVQSFERPDPNAIGFDAAVEFPPNLTTPTPVGFKALHSAYTGEVLSWPAMAEEVIQRLSPNYRLMRGVNCGWDNEPRRSGSGRSFVGSCPRLYRDWLRRVVNAEASPNEADFDRIVFLNGWNEWAEGAVLEPDARLGHAYLNATRSALRPQQSWKDDRAYAVVHVWYPDIANEIFFALRSANINWHIIITCPPELCSTVEEIASRSGLEFEIRPHENRGRDILPFLEVAHDLRMEIDMPVLKLHTKLSPHRHDGHHWRQRILDSLVRNGRASRICAAFNEIPRLGMIAPDHHLQPLHKYMGGNQAVLNEIRRRVGLAQARLEPLRFVPGSMFWVRLEALDRVLDCGLERSDFEPEGGSIDGTLAHALERVFVTAAEADGWRVESSDFLEGLSAPQNDSFPFADLY